jgi:hypothetical protein
MMSALRFSDVCGDERRLDSISLAVLGRNGSNFLVRRFLLCYENTVPRLEAPYE